MRYLRKQVLNRRAPYDQRLYVDIDNSIVMRTPKHLRLPSGDTSNRPVLPINGMIRYNTELNEIEVYQASTWRSLRFKEPTKITQQNLGAGDSNNVFFGPLDPSPAGTVQSGITWDTTQMAKNMLVIVENVIQISQTNYTVVQNPNIPAEIYDGKTSTDSASGSQIITINSHVIATGVSSAVVSLIRYATITFASVTNAVVAPFAVGSLIIVSGFRPSGYNGTYTVTGCTTTSVTYANVTTDTMTVAGDVVSTVAIYPSVNINNAVVTDPVNGTTYIDTDTRVQSYITHPITNALLKITLTKPLKLLMVHNSSITITDASNAITSGDYYLQFGDPVPYGKPVTVLHGFDK
jgi:hypothetical protein